MAHEKAREWVLAHPKELGGLLADIEAPGALDRYAAHVLRELAERHDHDDPWTHGYAAELRAEAEKLERGE